MARHNKCCLGCDEREIGCHSWCERYERECKKNEARKARQRQEHEVDHYIHNVTADKLDHAAKHKRDRSGIHKPSGK